MAASDHIQNMYDISLKPRLLRSLLKQHIPDEKHPCRNTWELSRVVSVLKTHRLLSESVTHQADQKQMEIWKSTVDAWVNRLLTLVSNNMPDKCWVGICLLGVTCQECNSDRFLGSYSVWFNTLLSHIQTPTDSSFVKIASCAAISDLFTRLGKFPNVKKDGTSQAAKLIQPVLKLLNEDSCDAVWEGAVSLICTIINVSPTSVYRHYDSAEAAIVSKIMSGKCSVNILKKLGHGLALLPKSKGDEDTWLLMMHKILFSINVHLNDVLQGLEEETKSNEAMRILFPPGKDPPPPLGGQKMLGEASDQATKRPERLLIASVSTLMLCCCTMLSSSYPVQVTVPVRPLVALASRVLMVDGSLSQALLPFMIATQQEFICSELPVLHSYILEVLTAIVKGLRSQLLPHAADVIRLLSEYFKRCALPELRIKVYSIIKILLLSMGVGMTICLTEEVIYNAFIDLDSIGHEGVSTYSSAHPMVSSEALLRPCQRKRKHASTIGTLVEQPDRVALEVEMQQNLTPTSLKIAAVEALEALLTVGGALRSESWRSNIDHLLFTVATNACKGGWAQEEKNIFLSGQPTPSWADFQLAALRALLASLLSPARVRPPYLAQGLELFRRGMQETGTRLAEFCAHALLALEVLIHPRSLPLVDFPSAMDNSIRKFPQNIYSTDHSQKNSFPISTRGKEPVEPISDDDDLYKSWLANDDEVEVPVTEPGKNTSHGEQPSETSNDPLTKESEPGTSTAADAKRIRGDGDEISVEAQRSQETIKPYDEDTTRKGGLVAAAMDGPTGAKSGTVISDNVVSDPMDIALTGKSPDTKSGEDVSTALHGKDDDTILNSDRSKGFLDELDNESSMDSLPDIVDGDPDSD